MSDPARDGLPPAAGAVAARERRCADCGFPTDTPGTLCPRCGAPLPAVAAAAPAFPKLWCPVCWGLRGVLLYAVLIALHGWPRFPAREPEGLVAQAVNAPARLFALVMPQDVVFAPHDLPPGVRAAPVSAPGAAPEPDCATTNPPPPADAFSPWAFVAVGAAGYFVFFWLLGEILSRAVCRRCRAARAARHG